MKLAQKLLAAFLAVTLVVGMTACSGGTDTTTSGGTPVSDTELSSDSTDYSEKMTISYAAVAMVEGVDYNADELSKHFQEKFNIDWEPIALT